MLPWEFSEEYVMCLNHSILNYVSLNLHLQLASSVSYLGNIAPKEDASLVTEASLSFFFALIHTTSVLIDRFMSPSNIALRWHRLRGNSKMPAFI